LKALGATAGLSSSGAQCGNLAPGLNLPAQIDKSPHENDKQLELSGIAITAWIPAFAGMTNVEPAVVISGICSAPYQANIIRPE
jgi:hypothetical protein